MGNPASGIPARDETEGVKASTVAHREKRRLARQDRFAKRPLVPAELTVELKLLVAYMTGGCPHRGICEAHGVEPDKPLSVIEAADVLGIRRRRARAVMTAPVMQRAVRQAVAAIRDGAKIAAAHEIVALSQRKGEDSAADAKVRLEAAKTILEEPDTRRNGVTVNIGATIAGYVLDLRPPASAPPTFPGPTIDMTAATERPDFVSSYAGFTPSLPAPQPSQDTQSLAQCRHCGQIRARGRPNCMCEG